MMKKVLSLFLATLPVALWSGLVSADEERRPGPPDPGVMFQRLDQNKDGKVTADEVPDRAPEHVKELLKKADADGDKSVSAEEFRGALRKMFADRGGRPPFAGRGGPGPEGRPPFAGRGGPQGRPPAAARGGPEGRPPSAGRGDSSPESRSPRAGRGGPPRRPEASSPRGKRPAEGRGQAGPQRPERSRSEQLGPGMPNLEEVFNRMDRDNDGKLNQQEFAIGMRVMHSRMSHGPRPGARPGASHRGRPGPHPPMARGPHGRSSFHRGRGMSGRPPWAGGAGAAARFGPPGSPQRGPMADAARKRIMAEMAKRRAEFGQRMGPEPHHARPDAKPARPSHGDPKPVLRKLELKKLELKKHELKKPALKKPVPKKPAPKKRIDKKVEAKKA